MALTDKILYNQIDLEATQLFDYSIKPGEHEEEGIVLHAELLSSRVGIRPVGI